MLAVARACESGVATAGVPASRPAQEMRPLHCRPGIDLVRFQPALRISRNAGKTAASNGAATRDRRRRLRSGGALVLRPTRASWLALVRAPRLPAQRAPTGFGQMRRAGRSHPASRETDVERHANPPRTCSVHGRYDFPPIVHPMNSGDAAEADGHTRRRRPWAANITFLGVGLMIGGSTDISGPGGGILVVGVFVVLCGVGCLLFKRE